MSRWISAAALLMSLAAVDQARAQPSLDVVELTNGGFLRGTVFAYEPGEPVVVQLPNGTTRTIPASDVARVRISGAPATGPAPVAPSPPAERAPAMAGEPGPSADIEPEVVSAPALQEGEWWLDDGLASDDPTWRSLVPEPYQPHGMFHFGVTGGAGIVHEINRTRFGARFEVGAVIDVRPFPWSLFRLRAEALLSFMQEDMDMGLMGFAARLSPLSLDLGDWFVWRVSVELGGRYVDRTRRTFFYVAPSSEIAVTVLNRQLEIGILYSLPFIFMEYSNGGVGMEYTVRASYLF